MSRMVVGWCGDKKDVGETVGIWWKDKEEVLAADVKVYVLVEWLDWIFICRHFEIISDL